MQTMDWLVKLLCLSIITYGVSAGLSITVRNQKDTKIIFDPESLKDISVTENAEDGITLGQVLAIEVDGPVIYSLIAQPGTPEGEIKIDSETGELSVNNETPPKSNIDCDPDIVDLKYKVFASETSGNKIEAELTIKIVDVNDVTPILTVYSAITIPEEQAVGTAIPEAALSALDGDRDEPHNLVRFSISNAEAEAYFEVVNAGNNAGLLTVKSRIDRETLPTNSIVVNIVAMDNDGSDGLIDTKSVTVTITDINDNSPEIQTTVLTATENHGPDNPTIGVIEIIDNDQEGHVNSAVTLEIVKVSLGEQILDGFFALSPPVQTDQTTSTTLTALKSLRGFFGDIDIVLRATDGGLQTEGSVPDEETLKLTVDKYNFAKPTFTFPLEDKYILLLSDVDMPVLDITGANLEDIAADDNQEGKYEVDLKVLDPASTETDEIEHEYFKFLTGNPSLSSSKLYIKKKPEINIDYEVKFRATNRGGEPVLVEDKTVQFMFITDEQPVFETHEITQSIWENDPEAIAESSGASGLPLASFADVNNPLPVVYFLLDPVNMPFKIVTKDGEKYYGIAVDEDRFPEGLDREADNGEMYEVKVIATNGAIPATPDDKSILTVKMNIKNRNDNPPIFTEMMYYGALLGTLSQGSEIIKVQATDLDGPADIISYSITGYVGHGDAENVPEPLRIPDPLSGAITLNFAVTSSMQGYIELDLLATDSLEGVKNKGTSKALIYIVSDLHRVDFKFLNTIEQVDALQAEILAILKGTFLYECIFEKSETVTGEVPTAAVISVHFIDMRNNLPILKEEILKMAGSTNVIISLIGKFNKIDLGLKSIS